MKIPQPNPDYVTVRPTPALLTVVVGLTYGLLSYLYLHRGYTGEDFLELFLARAPEDYHVYSGPPGGFYQELGEALTQLDMENEPSSGSLQNVHDVSLTTRALGFAEESALNFKPGVANKVQVVAPLFQEKLQIFYDKEAWRKLLPKCAQTADGEGAEIEPAIQRTVSPCTKALLQRTTVHTGPSRSGTSALATALFELMEIDPNHRIEGDFHDQRNKLLNGGAQVGFSFKAPSRELSAYITSNRLGLMGVSPSLASALRRSAGLTFEPTGLDELEANRPTLGQMAWLIASHDVPREHLSRVLQKLDQVLKGKRMVAERGNVDTAMRRIAKRLDGEGRENRRQLWTTFSKFLLAMLGVMILTYRSFGWLWSAILHWKYGAYYERQRTRVDQLLGAESVSMGVATQLEHMAAIRKELRRELAAVGDVYRRGELSTRHRDGLSALYERLELEIQTRFRVLFLDLIREPYHPQLESAVRSYARQGDIDLSLYERAIQAWEAARGRYYSPDALARLTWSTPPPVQIASRASVANDAAAGG